MHIGKEANKWEERYFVGGDDEDAEIEYAIDQSDGSLDGKVTALCDQIGERKAAMRLGISRTALQGALTRGIGSLSRATRERLLRRMHFAG